MSLLEDAEPKANEHLDDDVQNLPSPVPSSDEDAGQMETPVIEVEKDNRLEDDLKLGPSKKKPNESDVSSPYQIQGFNDHNSNYSTYEFLDSLNEFVESQEINEFKAANALTIHVDESTDISKTKLLLLYTQHADCSNKVVRHMFHKVLNLQATDTSSIATAITDYFESKGIEGKKLVMFTSDGAAVMLGSRNGTAVKLKKKLNTPHVIAFHCVTHLQAHRVKDVCQMEKHVLFMKIEHILNDLIGFLNAHKHKVEIKALANIMETEYTNLELWIAVRWLSQSQSIQSVVKNLLLLIVYLEKSSKDYPATEGLFKKLSTVESLVKIHALNDVLMHLNHLNEQYQKENLHPYDVKVFADSICTLIEEFAVSHETIKNRGSMRVLKSRLNSDNATERLNYGVKMPRGSLNMEKELIEIEEK
uniref:DUF4371 domain-containing protein n=1 Tax=Romanomermis culicivorax TaxID=13658 RepID=A0A915K6C1_ROMCU